MTTRITHTLANSPDGALAVGVTARPAHIDGRHVLRVELTDQITDDGVPGVDYVDQPTFLRLPSTFHTGTLTVDVLARLNYKTGFESRAFAGIAFHITDDPATFSAVYLRPLNGSRLQPPPPRDVRAVQYFAYPAHPFDTLRAAFPDGRYEAAADIAPSEWLTLRVDVTDDRLQASVDDHAVIDLPLLAAPQPGDIGLFVDIGTEAYFRDLHITTT